MVALIVVLYALCASSFTLCKAVLALSKPIFFVGVRMIAAAAILLSFSWWKGGRLPSIARADRGCFAQIVVFHIYCAYVFDLWSLQYLTSFKSSFFFNLSPFITALFAYWMFNERLTVKKWLGLAIGFLGFVPTLVESLPSELQGGSLGWGISWPDMLMIASVSSACYGWVLVSSLLKRGYSAYFINGFGMCGGGLLALATSYCLEGWHPAPVTNLVTFIGLTALIILIVNIIFYNLYGYLLHFYSPTFLSFAGFMCPLFAALFGIIFLHETLTWTFIISAMIVFCGLYVFYQDELHQ